MTNLAAFLGQFTRWLQSLSPQKPIGISTLVRKFSRYLPAYQGIIQLEDGLYIDIDTKHAPEQALFFVGDRHRVLTALMRERVKQGAYCLDIGANIGFYTIKLAQLAGAEGRVAAFEANPHLLERIDQNLKLNQLKNVEIVQKAISQNSGTVEFYIAENSELSSLDYVEGARQKIQLESVSIDKFLQDQGWTRLDFIKLDIEGHDCQALLGAKESLQRFLPDIVVEYHYDTDKAVAEEAFSFLESLGYRMSGLMLRTSAHIPFDWKKSTDNLIHINVFCQAPNR